MPTKRETLNQLLTPPHGANGADELSAQALHDLSISLLDPRVAETGVLPRLLTDTTPSSIFPFEPQE